MNETERKEETMNEKTEELNQEEKQTDSNTAEIDGEELKESDDLDVLRDEESAKEKPGSRKHLPWVIGGAVLILVLVVGMMVGLQKQHSKRIQKTYEKQISQAEKSLEVMDFEAAKKAYEEAIRLEPKKSEPYLGMANLYVAQDQPDKAEAVLKKAVKQVEKKEQEEVKVRYQFYTYPKKALKKENGSCDAGEYECSYAGGFNEAGGGIWVESVHELQGILNWYMADYDEDGAEELLVLTLDNQRTLPSDYNSEIVRNGVDLQMYELVDGKPVLQATYQALEPVLGYGDEEEDGIFLQKKDGTVYICGSCFNGIYLYADGTVLNSFILTYQDGKFREEGGQLQSVAGSDWSDEVEVSNQMASLLDKMGLAKDAAKIREDHMPMFRFLDQPDHTLLRIHGENEGGDSWQFMQSGNVADLGKVKLTIKYGELAVKDEDGSKDNSQKGSQAVDAQPNSSGQPNQSSGSEYQNLYGPLLDQVYAIYGEYNDYYLYDIDKDGVKELLLQEGTCEADYMYQVYTIENGEAVSLGELSGGHTMFFEDTEGGNGSSILRMQAHMGYERISRVTLSNGSLSEEEISERELGAEEEYFDNGAPLPEAAVTDHSLLNERSLTWN